ncbi:hypothetical protein ES708_15750 [subsurface metagenome]
MVKILNIFGDQYSGQAGKAGVFAKWKGRQYRRAYVIPANPRTTMQTTVRGWFTEAVAFWHSLHSIQRLAFGYLATGLVMSGFNLFVSKWQKAGAVTEDRPAAPAEGIKQIASDMDEAATTELTPNGWEFPLGADPVKIMSLTHVPDPTDPDQDAYVDVEMGDVRVAAQLLNIDGLKAILGLLAEGDELVISYKSGGREVTREVLAEATEVEGDAAWEFAVQELTTLWYPIDFKSVVIEIHDLDGESPNDFVQLESLEILNCAYTIADSVVTPTPKIFFDLSKPVTVGGVVNYTDYTQIKDAKLEITKADTSFITWRRYSDPVGKTTVAQTIEISAYDWRLTAPGYVGVTREHVSPVDATEHELVVMTPSA